MRPFPKPGLRIPVYLMRRVMNALVGKTPGIMWSSTPGKQDFYVKIAFDSEIEAKQFYTAIEGLDPVKRSSP